MANASQFEHVIAPLSHPYVFNRPGSARAPRAVFGALAEHTIPPREPHAPGKDAAPASLASRMNLSLFGEHTGRKPGGEGQFCFPLVQGLNARIFRGIPFPLTQLNPVKPS